jgi:DNA-directed RNA polymerase subunit RPC12/RpoP
MQVESINCNHCGANLEVSPTTQFVTCKYCGSRLAVRRTESTTYTELIDALAPPLNAMAEQMGHIAHEQELARIDREWEVERQQYLITNRQGVPQVPNATMSVIGGIVITVFGIIWTVIASSITSSFPGEMAGGFVSCFPLFGVLFVVAGIAVSIYSYQKALAYQQAYAQYQQRRAAVRRPEQQERRPGGEG